MLIYLIFLPTATAAYSFRVDPYAPATVWLTLRRRGTHTGAAFGSGRWVNVCVCVYDVDTWGGLTEWVMEHTLTYVHAAHTQAPMPPLSASSFLSLSLYVVRETHTQLRKHTCS